MTLKRVSIVLLAALLVTQAVVVIVRADRQPVIDEVEYLHSGWLMANGGRLFVTFFQHHSPLLFAPLAAIAPHAERIDAQPYAERARLLAGLCGLIGLAAFAAVVSRGSPFAPFIAIAVFFGSGAVWLRTIADVRAEPFALALFWGGTALVLLPKKRIELAAGVGLGLIVWAGLWTPKWPLCSAVIGILALVRVRRGRTVMILIAAGIAAIGVAAIQAIAPLDLVRFFVIDFTGVVYRLLRGVPTAVFLNEPFYYAPSVFKLPKVLVAAAIVGAAALVDRGRERDGTREGNRERDRDFPTPLLFIVLFAVSVLEIRFVHGYPAVWLHNYGLWSLTAAAIYGFVPAAVVSLLLRANVSDPFRAKIALVVPAAAVLLVLPNVWTQVSFAENDGQVFWQSQRALVARMRPNETVFVPLSRHPITVHDAHYYWFAVDGGVYDVATELLRTERGARYLPPLRDWPICSALRGTNHLRFASRPLDYPTKSEADCFAALEAAGRVRRSPAPRIFEVLPLR